MITTYEIFRVIWSKNKSIRTTKVDKLKAILRISSIISRASFVFLWHALKYFFLVFVTLAAFIYCLIQAEILSRSIQIHFIIASLCGLIGMTLLSLVCVLCCINGNLATVLETARENQIGVRKGFFTAMRNSRVVGLFISFLMLLFLSAISLCIDFNYETTKIYSVINGVVLSCIFFAYLMRGTSGVFTKAADIGCDIAGKVFADIEEDSPANPGVIADNVGDIVGDGVGTCNTVLATYFTAFRVAACSINVTKDNLLIFAISVGLSILALFLPLRGFAKAFGENVGYQEKCDTVEQIIKQPIWYLIFLMVFIAFLLFLSPVYFSTKLETAKFAKMLCLSGVILFLLIASTSCFTATSSYPVRDTIEQTKTMGGAMNILYSFSYGILSVVILLLTCVIVLCISNQMQIDLSLQLVVCGSAVPVIICMDIFGPISDNAGGIANLADCPEARKNTEVLDSAGNTTKSLTKGFISGVISLCLVACMRHINLENITDMEVGLFITGLIFSLLSILVVIFMTLNGADIACASIKAKIHEFQEQKIMIEDLKPNYYTDVAAQITRYSCSTTAWTSIIFCISILTKSSLHGLGIATGALLFSVLMCTWGAIGDNVKKGMEQQKSYLLEMQNKLIHLIKDTKSKYPDFDLYELGIRKDGGKEFTEITTLKSKIDDLDGAIKASVIGDVVGDPLKDAGGTVGHVICLIGIFLMSS